MLRSRRTLSILSLLIFTITATTVLIAGSNNILVINNSKSVPDIDTISTACLSLAIHGNGSYGDQGSELVNMDYVNDGDCDPDADIYLYDGSPVVGWIDGADTVMYWSIFGGCGDSIYPTEVTYNYDIGNYVANTTTVLVIDSSIAVEKTYYAPQDGEDCNFILQHMRVYSYDNQDHDNLIIGEVVDWDIPSDSGSRNGSGFSGYEDWMAIWQYGAHYDDTVTRPCDTLKNNGRFGGMAFLTMYKWDGYSNTIVPGDGAGRPFHNAYTIDNPTYVFGNDYGFEAPELCSLMTTTTAFSPYQPNTPESTFVDLHSAMTFVDDYTLMVGETLNVWFSTFTLPIGSDTIDVGAVIEKSRDNFCEDILPGIEGYETDPFICGYGCCNGVRGDVLNDNGIVLVNDMVFLVNHLLKFGPGPYCMESGNLNADLASLVDISDIAYFKNLLYNQDGFEILPCTTVHPTDTITGINISLLGVDGLNPSTDTITTLRTLNFYFGVENNTPFVMETYTSGFRIYSPNDAQWTSTSISLTDDFDSHYFSTNELGNSITYSGADTTLFVGYNGYNMGLPVGYSDTAFKITIGPIENTYIGDTICIDSSWARPSHAWLWSDAKADIHIIPAWDGPHCFVIGSCCNHDGIRGDADLSHQINVADLTLMVNYIFKGGAPLPCMEEGDVNADGIVLVDDLTLMVNYIFKGGLPPAGC